MVIQLHYVDLMRTLYVQSLVLIFLSLGACRSSTRILSEEERMAHGLNGVIYDAPLCPMVLDKKSQITRVSGRCESVTCLPDGKKFRCTARKR